MTRKKNIAVAWLLGFFIVIMGLVFSSCDKDTSFEPDKPDVPPDTVIIQPKVPLDVKPISLALDVFVQPDNSVVSATVDIKTDGYYCISVSASYTMTANESFFLEIKRPDGMVQGTEDSNAGKYRVIVDENACSCTKDRAAGIFRMFKGQNTIRIRHYSQIAGLYPYYVQAGGFAPVHVLGLFLEFFGQR